MVGSKRGHAKSLTLKTKDLCYRHFGTLKMDKVELRTASSTDFWKVFLLFVKQSLSFLTLQTPYVRPK
jgi:hypothetical protein